MTLDRKQQKFLTVSILGIVIVFIALQLVHPWFIQRYHLGGDPQEATSGCAPWSMYLIRLKERAPPKRGELVAVSAPPYGKIIKDGLRITKFVVGVPGDKVEINNDRIWINGRYFGRLWLMGPLKKDPGSLDKIETIPEGYFLGMNVEKSSLDGRYWGYFENKRIIGRVSVVY